MMLQVLIKSPNQQVDDLEVQCDPSWTVGHLKDYLQSAYPTKPDRNQQRIIYCGRLLPDNIILGDVLTKRLDKYIMHLVCPQTTSNARSANMEAQVAPSQPGLQSSAENVLPTGASPGDALRNRFFNMQTAQFPMNANFGAMAVPPAYTAYQFTAMQQTYAQFIAHALAQNQRMGQSQQTSQPSAQSEQALPQQPAANNARQQNAAEDRQNEAFDVLYLAMKVLLLCMVLYFYSTPAKVFLVMSLGFLFCMYRAYGYQQGHQDVPNSRSPHPREVDGGAQANLVEDNSNDDLGEQNAAAPEATALNSFFSFPFLTFIKTFFTSLIPEQPLPIQT